MKGISSYWCEAIHLYSAPLPSLYLLPYLVGVEGGRWEEGGGQGSCLAVLEVPGQQEEEAGRAAGAGPQMHLPYHQGLPRRDILTHHLDHLKD